MNRVFILFYFLKPWDYEYFLIKNNDGDYYFNYAHCTNSNISAVHSFVIVYISHEIFKQSAICEVVEPLAV